MDPLILLLGGSSINIGTLDCSAVASLTSHGGPITVNGLDGRATIDSSGGKIKVLGVHTCIHCSRACLRQ
jgi:hypothetical protein